MTLKEAARLFASGGRVGPLADALNDKTVRRVALTRLPGSAPAVLMASLDLGRPALVVADDFDAAGYLYNDLSQILGPEAVAVFPSGYRRDIKYGQPDPPSQILRTETLDAIANSKKLRWIVSCPEALAEKVPAPESLADDSLTIRKGERVSQSDVVSRLLELGFRTADYVYEPGQFARRGSILDVYSFSAELPYRFDFFDDEIDSIRTFNIETQLSEKSVDSASLLPSVTSGAAAQGVSLLDFISDRTPVFCQQPSWLLQRVAAICSESLSQSVAISGEGDPDAMSKLVDHAA